MRTLQEKYNAIQEGKFSKEHFLAEARMQQPQLITRFNGYDDAVQILKNRGMIAEAKKVERREALELKKLQRRYEKTPHLLSATLNRNKALKNLPGLLQKFTISKSTKSRKSPKNPFMVNRTKPFSMNSLLNEITKLNKK